MAQRESIKLMDVIKVSKPRKVKGENYKVYCDIDWLGENKSLWLTYPKEFDSYVDSSSVDWVATALLIPAMLAKSDLIISGTISSSLYYFLCSDIQKILHIQNPDLSQIKIHVDEMALRCKANDYQSASGFSAGVDSFSSLALLGDSQALKPNYLATLNVGAMGKGDNARKMLKKYATRLTEFCVNHNYKPLIIDSNIDEFFEGLSYQATHSIRSAAAILALGGAISRYYYSSTFEYPSIGVSKTYDMSYADPILLPLFSTEATEFRAIGTNLSRLQKVELISDYETSYKYLDVCVGDPAKRLKSDIPNCSQCWKCSRQLMTLELLGSLEQYSDVFDLEKYHANKQSIVFKHMMNVLLPNRPNDWDVIKLAELKGVMNKSNIKALIRASKLSWRLRRFIANKLAKTYTESI